MQIIGITGLARSGKDTLAGFLVEDHGFSRFALADPIRNFVGEITGLSREELTDGPHKEQPLAWIDGQKSPRMLMQSVGTEWGRDTVDRELWVKVLGRKVREARRAGAPGVVIPDVRFDNEAAAIRSWGGRIVRVIRDQAPAVASHVSEAGVSDELVQSQFWNYGPLFEMRRFAASLVALRDLAV